MICAKCKTNNPSGAKFCEKCGAELQQNKKVETGVQPSKVPAIPRKFILAAVLLILLLIAGIFGYQQLMNTPETVVSNYFQALGKQDLTTALSLITPSERLAVKDSLEHFLGSIERLEIQKVVVKNLVVSGDEASVDVKLDFEIKPRYGNQITYLASKDTLIIFDGKTKVEVPLSEVSRYSEAQPLFKTIKLEKDKGRWYITYR